MSDARTRAERIVRRFARETNLALAGRPLEIRGIQRDPELAAALREMAAGLGMRVVDQAAGVDPARLTVDLGGEPLLALGGHPLPARQGADARIAFARDHMPASAEIAGDLARNGVLADLRVGLALPLEPKTAVLAVLLAQAGAAVSVYAHPDETDAEVADALRRLGLPVSADASRTGAAERAAAVEFVRSGLDLLVDDGAHLIRLAHAEAPESAARWIGASEETTSGVTALRRMAGQGALLAPVMATNDAATKTAFDNRYGTGQSCVLAIADLLEPVGLTVRDQRAVVAGYGPVGEGVAAHLRALGADVAVAERDPVRALLAHHDGFEVGPLAALASGALLVSATGAAGTVTPEIAATARVIAVAGGTPGEVGFGDDAGQRFEPAVSPGGTATQVEAWQPHGTLVLGRGGAVNLTAAEGNPIEIMDLSFATQLAAIEHLVGARPAPGLHVLPQEAVHRVAEIAARTRGLAVESPDHAAATGPADAPGRFGGAA